MIRTSLNPMTVTMLIMILMSPGANPLCAPPQPPLIKPTERIPLKIPIIMTIRQWWCWLLLLTRQAACVLMGHHQPTNETNPNDNDVDNNDYSPCKQQQIPLVPAIPTHYIPNPVNKNMPAVPKWNRLLHQCWLLSYKVSTRLEYDDNID